MNEKKLINNPSIQVHCVSEWGHDFRPAFRRIEILRDHFPSVPLMALTATATSRVRDDVITSLRMRKDVLRCQRTFRRPNLFFSVEKKGRNPRDDVIRCLQSKRDLWTKNPLPPSSSPPPVPPTIVYCMTVRDTEKIAADLSSHGFPAIPYHAQVRVKRALYHIV